MNSFLFSAIALCLVAQSGLASHQSAGYGQQQQQQQQYGSGYQQRKMAPMPQQYQPQQQQPMQYQQQQSYEMAPAYEQQPYEQQPYKSSAAVSQYDERTPAYTSARAPAAYAAKTSAYASAAPSYAAKPAPKYEEPAYYPPMPFAWGYDINDGYGGAQYHKENGDEYGKRTGSYGYTDAYGVYRQVDYVADEHGFRATIKTNEPGTSNESPADVEMHAYEPPSNYYAGSGAYQQKAQQQSYSAPAAPSYSAPARSQQYAAAKPAYQSQPQPQPQQQQYSAASMPAYQKVAAPRAMMAGAGAAAKRAY